MALRTYNDYVARRAAGYWRGQPMWAEVQVAIAQLLGSNIFTIHSAGDSQLMPNPLPSGVTACIPTSLSQHSQGASQDQIIFAKLVNLGSLDISGPTFTDASAMPTSTVLGTTNQSAASCVMAEVTTGLNATPGSISITYKNQSGTGGQTSTSQALTASAAIRSTGFIALASGDWGVQDITAATRTGGTTPTGVVKFWGLIPICLSPSCPLGSGDQGIGENMLSTSVNPVRLGAGDRLGAFLFGSTAVKSCRAWFFITGDN